MIATVLDVQHIVLIYSELGEFCYKLREVRRLPIGFKLSPTAAKSLVRAIVLCTVMT
jgi:hypothetical protein